jgi:hypothetical protein
MKMSRSKYWWTTIIYILLQTVLFVILFSTSSLLAYLLLPLLLGAIYLWVSFARLRDIGLVTLACSPLDRTSVCFVVADLPDPHLGRHGGHHLDCPGLYSDRRSDRESAARRSTIQLENEALRWECVGSSFSPSRCGNPRRP